MLLHLFNSPCIKKFLQDDGLKVYVFTFLVLTTLHEGRMGFSSVLRKVRYVVLLISHIGGPILKDILKFFDYNISRKKRESTALNLVTHSIFRER